MLKYVGFELFTLYEHTWPETNSFNLHFSFSFFVRLIGAASWYNEYRRLTYNIPMVLTDELQYAHSHQVLHVSFSHDGKMFATCSKDGFVHVRESMKWPQIRSQFQVVHFYLFADMEFIVSGDNQILT